MVFHYHAEKSLLSSTVLGQVKLPFVLYHFTNKQNSVGAVYLSSVIARSCLHIFQDVKEQFQKIKALFKFI
jgi:hypothetical protein